MRRKIRIHLAIKRQRTPTKTIKSPRTVNNNQNRQHLRTSLKRNPISKESNQLIKEADRLKLKRKANTQMPLPADRPELKRIANKKMPLPADRPELKIKANTQMPLPRETGRSSINMRFLH